MKKSLVALSIAAAIAAPAANAAPKVYGKLNLSVEEYKVDYQDPAKSDEQYSRSVSNASRFGVKGEDELTADLSAVYQVEWEVAADGEDASGLSAATTTTSTTDAVNVTAGAAKVTSTSSTSITSSKLDLYQRNRFIGIKSQKFGTVKLGKYDTYTKLAQGEIDLFNDYLGDMKYVIAGENRINNVVGYESPKFFDALTVNVMTQTQDTVTAPKNGTSLSVVYNSEEKGLYGALAVDQRINGATALSGNRVSNNVRLVGSYKIADLTVNGIVQTSEASSVAAGVNKNKETGWQLGAAYKIGDETLKVQYGQAEADYNKAATQKRTQWSVGADHNFTSKTKAFVWYTSQEEDKLAANADTKITAFAGGIEHKF